jgi:hypothetical protein
MTDLMSKRLDRLGKLLSLDIDGWGQDWEFVYANPDRVEEFCDVYEREPLTSIEKGELMRLIVASYDRRLEHEGAPNDTWQRIARLLKAESVIHKEIVGYWSLLEETDTENMFSITPLMRTVWHDCNGGEI